MTGFIYKFKSILGKGTFGSVYKGQNKRTDENVAIKIANIIHNHEDEKMAFKILKHEASILNHLRNEKFIPNLRWFGKYDNVSMLVTDLLGISLLELTNISLCDMLYILNQGVNLLESCHKNNIIHRDIKPENFMFDLATAKQLYIIDFGLAKYNKKCYNKDKKTGFIGNIIFSSIRVMEDNEPYFKDDLISFMYTVIFIYTKSIPWGNLDIEDYDKYKLEVLKLKKEYTPSRLCKSMPLCIEKIMIYSNSIINGNIPDYNYLRKIINNDLKMLSCYKNNNFNVD